MGEPTTEINQKFLKSKTTKYKATRASTSPIVQTHSPNNLNESRNRSVSQGTHSSKSKQAVYQMNPNLDSVSAGSHQNQAFSPLLMTDKPQLSFRQCMHHPGQPLDHYSMSG